MADYDNTDKGTLFKNDKQGNDKRPDYRGSLNVGGDEYWISGWIREAGPNAKKPGEKFMSLAIELKDSSKPAAPSHGVPDSAFQEDVPFMAHGCHIGRGFHVV